MSTPDEPIPDDVIDEVLCPALKELVDGLIAAGRQPDQAIDDIRRCAGHLQTQLDLDRRDAIARGEGLPG